MNDYQPQANLGSFTSASAPSAPAIPSADDPPVPTDQEGIELLTPEATLDALRDPSGGIRRWLDWISERYSPPSEADVCLLYPCASEKPMPESKTYEALSDTLGQYPEPQRRRIHIITVSEPMGLIPFEFQSADDPTWLYDNPGLFEWHVKENDRRWNRGAQQQALQLLGEGIAGFIDRALEHGWYDHYIACVRHTTCDGNESGDQTHRQMLEIVEAITGIEFEWVPDVETVTELTEERGPMAWQMGGVSHPVAQADLADALDAALGVMDE